LQYAKEFYNISSLKDMKSLQQERSAEQQLTFQSQVSQRKLQEVTSMPE
jgi:hypothetical protein